MARAQRLHASRLRVAASDTTRGAAPSDARVERMMQVVGAGSLVTKTDLFSGCSITMPWMHAPPTLPALVGFQSLGCAELDTSD